MLDGLAQIGEQRFLLTVFLHVDEIDDDDAADISQADLLEDLRRRLEVRLIDGVAEARFADVFPGIDVDNGERLRLVDDEEATRLQRDLARTDVLDLLLDAVFPEKRFSALVESDARRELRQAELYELYDAVIDGAIVDNELVDIAAEEVAHNADDEVGVAVEERGRAAVAVSRRDGIPKAHEIGHILLKRLLRDADRRRAHDEPHALRRVAHSEGMETGALRLILDAAG